MGDGLTGKEKYQQYLRSEHWRITKAAALETAKHRCQVCNSVYGLQVHHRTYERLGAEEPSDLTVLCDKCHTLFSNNGRLARESLTDEAWSAVLRMVSSRKELPDNVSKKPDAPEWWERTDFALYFFGVAVLVFVIFAWMSGRLF